jgi:steroid delta-isomerase-like uncharacterized protein
MFGSIFRLRPKPGREQEVVALHEEWGRDRALRVKGVRAGHLFHPLDRPGELVGVAVFADRDTYTANANDPEHDAWYRRLRGLLEADPIWEDGDVLYSGTGNLDACRVVLDNFAAFSAHDFDRGASTIAPDATMRDVPTGTVLTGPEGLRQYWRMWLTAFPDGRTDVTRCVGSDDGTVVTEFVGRGTHNGPLMGPGGRQIQATGRRVEIPFCQIATIRDGRIANAAIYYDLATIMGQLGIPSEPSAAQPSKTEVTTRRAAP